MGDVRSKENPSDLSPEKRSRVEALLASRNNPEAREAQVRDREELVREYAETGDIETAREPITLEMLVKLRKLIADLKEHRIHPGLSLATIAERSGIDQPALSRLEKGRGNPTFETLSCYVQALEVSVNFSFEVLAH